MLKKWGDEVEHNQRMLYNLMLEFAELDYYDKDIWERIFKTIVGKTKINNLTFFSYFNTVMRKLNEDPKSAFFKQLDARIAKFKERHYTTDR